MYALNANLSHLSHNKLQNFVMPNLVQLFIFPITINIKDKYTIQKKKKTKKKKNLLTSDSALTLLSAVTGPISPCYNAQTPKYT